MTTLTREQVLQIIESARVKSEILKLLGADRAEMELPQAQLGGIDLTQSGGTPPGKTQRGGLVGADLSQANLKQTNLNGANLRQGLVSQQPGRSTLTPSQGLQSVKINRSLPSRAPILLHPSEK